MVPTLKFSKLEIKIKILKFKTTTLFSSLSKNLQNLMNVHYSFGPDIIFDTLFSPHCNNIIYKCLDRASIMPREDLLIGPVVKKY